MAFDFPPNPAFDQAYSKHGVSYRWNGYGWILEEEGDQGFSAFEQEYTLPGEILVEIPVGATKVAIDAIGAGGPGCVEGSTFRQEFTPESIKEYPPVTADDIRELPEQFQEWLPNTHFVPVPADARGKPCLIECIGSGGAGERDAFQVPMGGGGGAYANKVHTLLAGETELIVSVADATPITGQVQTVSSYVLARAGNVMLCYADGGNLGGEPGLGGGSGAPGWSDLNRHGGNGFTNGGGGSGACKTAAGNHGTAAAGGASPGLPAGAGGAPGVKGSGKGGGGGAGAFGGMGWVAIEWNYTGTPAPTGTGGGGGGGGYARTVDVATAGLTGLYLTVPPPPTANTLINGDAAIVRSNTSTGPVICQAAGGNHGISQGVGDGLGGQAAGSVGDFKYSGGTGFFSTAVGGGGGAAASLNGNGNNALGEAGGASTGYPAGSGGAGGNVGGNYGGGGGTNRAGGGGYIKLSWS
jgi:hypothetical protein